MKKAVPALIGLATLVLLCWVFPPFHVRSLKAVRKEAANQRFNAADFAASYWTETLLPAAEQAADAATVLDRIASDPKSVRDQFGRTVGVGNSYYLFLRGAGRVVSADGDSIGLSMESDGNAAEIVIPLGFVFGNAVRDGTGLLDPSDHPNAQEFNEISAALNGIVETNVLPRVQEIAKAGSRIEFVGCAEVGDEDLDLMPLKLVPIQVGEQKH